MKSLRIGCQLYLYTIKDISSLSAILLDDDYYEFLKQGKVTVDGVTVLDAAYLIPFKAKAWMDLTDRKAAGEHVDIDYQHG